MGGSSQIESFLRSGSKPRLGDMVTGEVVAEDYPWEECLLGDYLEAKARVTCIVSDIYLSKAKKLEGKLGFLEEYIQQSHLNCSTGLEN